MHAARGVDATATDGGRAGYWRPRDVSGKDCGSNMMFHAGVIGATGYIGTPYRTEMRGAPDAARIVALCARRRDRLQAAARLDGCEFITDDWRAVVEHPEVDLVVVLTPDRLHREPALAAAAAGKHLFCDKPVGADVGEAYEIWRAYRDSGLGHYVPYWTRYEPKFRRAKELLAGGELGELKVVVYRWHNPRPPSIPFTWRDDAALSTAGSIADVGSHAYDTVRWLIGSEAKRVVAQAGVLAPPKPDLGPIDLTEALEWGAANPASAAPRTRAGTAYDYGAIVWEFHNGAVGAMLLSHAPALRKGLAPELELHGSEASVAVDRVRHTVTLMRSDEDVTVEEIPEDRVNRWSRFVLPALAERAAGRECAHPGLHDGWRTQVFTEAVVASARRGEWVELAELDADEEAQ